MIRYGDIRYEIREYLISYIRYLLSETLGSAVGIGELLQLCQNGAVGLNGDGSDLLLLQRTVGSVGLDLCDGIHHIHAGSHLAEGCILAVQVLGILVHDEELGAGGVGGLGTGHRQNAALVLQVVLDAVEEELTLDAVAGATHAGALGAAALDHEAGDDTVEDQAVIVVVLSQIDEIGNALGCLVGIQLALDNTAVFHGDLKSRIHNISIPFFHSPVDLALSVLLSRGLSFVIKLLALAQADLDLHAAALKVNGQGDQGITVLLHLTEKPHDLTLVHQKTPGAAGIRVESVAVVIGRDVHLVKDQLAVFDAAPGILQIQRAGPDGLDLGTHQLDTGFVFFFDEIFMPGFPVGGHDFYGLLFQIAHLLKLTPINIIPYLSRE